MITYFQEKNAMIKELVKISSELENNYCSVIINLSTYYPFPHKNNILTKKYVNDMSKILKRAVNDNLVWELFEESNEGPMFFMGVNGDAESLKKLMACFEDNHVLGKWMLIEVYNNLDNSVITREMLGISERKCVICGKNLKECTDRKTHSIFDIIREINRSYVEYKEGIE